MLPSSNKLCVWTRNHPLTVILCISIVGATLGAIIVVLY